MQNLIYEIRMLYEFKYPDAVFSSLQYEDNIVAREKAIFISSMLGFDQLKFRMHHDYVQFLECNYVCLVNLKRPKEYCSDLCQFHVGIYDNGEIKKTDLEGLMEFKFIDNVDGISRAEELYGRFESIDTAVDYSELTNCVLTHKYYVSLRNKILRLIPLAILYSENTLPEYGYVRALNYIEQFNKEFNLDIDTNELDKIMSVDYSKTGKVKVKK